MSQRIYKSVVVGVMFALLVGCATTKSVEVDDLPQGDHEASAAVGRAGFAAWVGKALMRLLRNTRLNVTVDATNDGK